MRPSTIATRYAEASYQVASEDNAVSEWLQSLVAISDAIQRPDVSGFFKNPDVGRDEKLAMVDRIAAGAPEEVRNLLHILAVIGRLHLVPSILDVMRTLDRTAHNVVEVYVTVARPISDAEGADIGQRLGTAVGKTVEIHTRVDPDILGGIIVRLGDRLIDASIKGRLDRLRNQLAS